MAAGGRPRSGSVSAGYVARMVKPLQGAADHPVDLAFPAGKYLKGLPVQAE